MLRRRPLAVPRCSLTREFGPKNPVTGHRQEVRICGRQMTHVKSESGVYWFCQDCDRAPVDDWGGELLEQK